MEHQSKPLTEFEGWPKIPRASKASMVITEKLDGSNGQVVIGHAEPEPNEPGLTFIETEQHGLLYVRAGSRNRWLQPGKNTDNYGFAAWVQEHAQELVKLGPGRWYGEWYGQGIGRNYGLDHRRFALFYCNTNNKPECCEVVPTLYYGPHSEERIQQVHAELMEKGSVAVPGFMRPEGVVIQYRGFPQRVKITDEEPGGYKTREENAS